MMPISQQSSQETTGLFATIFRSGFVCLLSCPTSGTGSSTLERRKKNLAESGGVGHGSELVKCESVPEVFLLQKSAAGGVSAISFSTLHLGGNFSKQQA
ncbi:unnamed protein product [Calypogeia fissa]